MNDKRIVFSEQCVVGVPDGDDIVFEAGKAYSLPLASCDRWIRRGVAQLESDMEQPKPRSKKDK